MSLELQARTNVGKKLIKFIEANPDKPWHWACISRNPNITMEIIKANPDKHWNWEYYGISKNPNITMEIIKANPVLLLENKVENAGCKCQCLKGI